MRTLALLAAAAAFLAGAATAASAPPVLHVPSRQPLRVSGAHFRPRELVVVTATATARWTVRVRASRAGTFVVGFGSLPIDRCAGLGIRAVGAGGSVAVAKLPLPACLPASSA